MHEQNKMFQRNMETIGYQSLLLQGMKGHARFYLNLVMDAMRGLQHRDLGALRGHLSWMQLSDARIVL